MAGRYDLSEPDAVEQELAAMFPWASDTRLHAAAELVHARLDLSGEQPSITADMLDDATATGVAVAHVLGPAPGQGGGRDLVLDSFESVKEQFGALVHMVQSFVPGVRRSGGDYEPPADTS